MEQTITAAANSVRLGGFSSPADGKTAPQQDLPLRRCVPAEGAAPVEAPTVWPKKMIGSEAYSADGRSF